MKGVVPPPHVLASLPGTLTVLTESTRTSLYLREDNWELKKYPRDCAIELRLGIWDMEPVLVVALLLRLARSDATTFDRLLDVSLPENVRLLQRLARHAQVDVHLATDVIARSFRIANSLRAKSADLVRDLRERAAWSKADFQQASQRLTQLYPTPDRLWWVCEESGE